MTNVNTTLATLRYLRAVQSVLTSLGHNHKMDQQEYEHVLDGHSSGIDACDCVSHILSVRAFIDEMQRGA